VSLLASGPSSAPLELLAPSGLALAALVAPLVVLYILKVRRKRQRVGSTWLWAAAQRDLMARSPWKRLIAQVPLLLEALAVIALALALARPATRSPEILGDHVAVVLDASASMSARAPKPDGAPGETTMRMDLAKKAAKDVLASLTPGTDAMIVEAGRDARVASPLERDRRRLEAVVDRVAALDLEGDLASSVALAADRLRQLGGSKRIVVVTDGALAHPGGLRASGVPVEIVTVGSPVDNAALVRVDVRSGSAEGGREEVQAFAIVANYGAAPRELYVTMREDNASDVLASRKILVAPGERQPVVLAFHPSAGDYRRGLVVELAPHDAMPVDDVAYARVPAGEALPVYLASPDDKPSAWMERALLADPRTEVHRGTTADLLGSARVPPDALVVVERACPDAIPGGDVLVVAPPAGTCLGTRVGRTLEHPLLTSWETGDPRMRFVSLDGVHVAKATALDPEGPSQALVRTQDGVIASDVSTPARAGTLLGFDVGESDWPLKASFVLFVRNVLEQARAHRTHGITGPARVGEPMRVSLPRSATDATVASPSGEPTKIPVRAGLAVVPDVPHAGLYHVSWQGPQAGSIVVPANLASEAESDLRARPAAIATDSGDEPTVVRRADERPDAHSEWTWLLALGALALVLGDVWYTTRRVRVTSPVASARAPKLPERKAA
jgi:hypothetical protein